MIDDFSIDLFSNSLDEGGDFKLEDFLNKVFYKEYLKGYGKKHSRKSIAKTR